MHKNLFPILCVALLFASGCASTNYRAFEGRNTVFEGEGGTRDTVDGVDFWEFGEPPRKYQLLGIITDERPAGLIPMARLKGDIAKEVKTRGADAVIILASGSRLMGMITNSSATTNIYGGSAVTTGSSMSMPVRRNSATFAVIKYLE